ncbi:MAG: bacteriochlorophyll c-binding family protein [Chlorobiaceae bacterium]
MPQEPLEALIERMKSDSAFRAELQAREDIVDRLELILSAVLSNALGDINQAERNIVEDGEEISNENNLSRESSSTVLKGSSPHTAGYAKPSKSIEQRFND